MLLTTQFLTILDNQSFNAIIHPVDKSIKNILQLQSLTVIKDDL